MPEGAKASQSGKATKPVAPITPTLQSGSRFHLRASTPKKPHMRPMSPNISAPPTALWSNSAPDARANTTSPARMIETPRSRPAEGQAPSTRPATSKVQTIEADGANKVLWLAGIIAVAVAKIAP